jgi:hypothetical protein
LKNLFGPLVINVYVNIIITRRAKEAGHYYRPLEVRNPIGSWRGAEPLAPVTMNGSGFSGGLYYGAADQ